MAVHSLAVAMRIARNAVRILCPVRKFDMIGTLVTDREVVTLLYSLCSQQDGSQRLILKKSKYGELILKQN